MQRAYRESMRALSALLVLLGIAMAVAAVARGGGPLALGVVLGVLFALLGLGRLVLAGRPGDGGGRSAAPRRGR